MILRRLLDCFGTFIILKSLLSNLLLDSGPSASSLLQLARSCANGGTGDVGSGMDSLRPFPPWYVSLKCDRYLKKCLENPPTHFLFSKQFFIKSKQLRLELSEFSITLLCIFLTLVCSLISISHD